MNQKNQSLLFYRGLVQNTPWTCGMIRHKGFYTGFGAKLIFIFLLVIKGWRDWLQELWKQLCQWLPVCSVQAHYRGKAWHVTFRNLSQTKSPFKLLFYLHAHQHSNCLLLKCMIHIIQNRLGSFVRAKDIIKNKMQRNVYITCQTAKEFKSCIRSCIYIAYINAI